MRGRIRDFKLLRFTTDSAAAAHRGRGPQGLTGKTACTVLCLLLCAIPWGHGHVLAQEKLKNTNDLDGFHLSLGPLGNATYSEGGWDSAFGLEMGMHRIQERHALTALGVTGGGIWYSAREGGRAWLHLEGATTLFGLVLGLGAGPTVDYDEMRPPRWGAQANLWLFAGVLPTLRVGKIEGSGVFAELGIRIALPALRW